jgi:hypothetical protein
VSTGPSTLEFVDKTEDTVMSLPKEENKEEIEGPAMIMMKIHKTLV